MSARERWEAAGGPKEAPPRGPASWPPGRAHLRPQASPSRLLFMISLYHGKTYALICTYFSETVAEAIVLLFFEIGLILLLRGCHRGEFNIVIAIGIPLAWGEVPSSSSIETSPSPSSSPLRLTSSPHSLCRSEP
jgi:hypothetical protein